MSFTVGYEIYHKTDDGYKMLDLYTADGKRVDILPYCDHLLNQTLVGYNRHGFDNEPIGERRGVPEWYQSAVYEFYKKMDALDDDGNVCTTADDTYYDYLELKGYALNDGYVFVDWDDDFNNSDAALDEEGWFDESKVHKRHPLKDFMRAVDIVLDAYHIWYPKPGEVIIVARPSY